MTSAYGITIHNNCVKHHTTWIPLDAVACLQTRSKTNSFMGCMFTATAIIVLTATAVDIVYKFIHEDQYNRNFIHFILDYFFTAMGEITAPRASHLSSVASDNHSQIFPRIFACLVMAAVSISFWKTKHYIEIIANSGNKISIMTTESALKTFFGKKGDTQTINTLFSTIVENRHQYLEKYQDQHAI